MNEEQIKDFEKRLSNHAIRRRVITAAFMIIFLIIGIVFWSQREASREVIVHGEGLLSYETVTYNNDYAVGIVIGFVTAMLIGCFLFTDLLCCRFRTAEANGHYITVYRGMMKCSVYINGEEKDSIGMGSFTNVIDTRMPDGTKISVAFSRGAFMIAHISFSDNNPPIDL
jgi:hypothetical protein